MRTALLVTGGAFVERVFSDGLQIPHVRMRRESDRNL